MEVPEQAKKVILKSGNKYIICSCGNSKTLPFCDDTHKEINKQHGTNYRPLKIWPEKDITLKVFSKAWKMFLTCEEVKDLIEKALHGSKVQVTNPRNDGKHLQAIVIYKGFKGKSLLEQHRIVYKILGENLKERIHALALETRLE